MKFKCMPTASVNARVQLLLLTISNLSAANSSMESKYEMCDSNTWLLESHSTPRPREAILILQIPPYEIPRLYLSTLSCDHLLVKGNGSVYFKSQSSTPGEAHFTLTLPDTMGDLASAAKDLMNHTCFVDISSVDESNATDDRNFIRMCQIRIMSFLGRILPRCNNPYGANLLTKVDVKKKSGRIVLYFGRSPNDVITHHKECQKGSILDVHTWEDLKNKAHSLSSHGTPTALSITFRPNCDNYTHANEPVTDCYLDVFYMCQEGVTLIKRIEPEFDPEALQCTKKVENPLALTFHIQSVPVCVLLLGVIVQCIIVACLLLTLAIKCLQFKLSKTFPWLMKSSRKKHKRYKILPTTEQGHNPSEVDSEPLLIKHQSLHSEMFVNLDSPVADIDEVC